MGKNDGVAAFLVKYPALQRFLNTSLQIEVKRRYPGGYLAGVCVAGEIDVLRERYAGVIFIW